MPERPAIDDEPEGEGHRIQISADAVRAGDTVVWTSRLNKEYRFTVADVDSTWLTFRTGGMVHKDRFDRGNFAVVRTREEPSPAAETGGRTAADDGAASATEGQPGEEANGIHASVSSTN